jgi:NAD(P)-dependent dehydrogenase (short-subunit alcohol dehydrogenase family)
MTVKNYEGHQKVCIVTGGNSGVGLMTTVGLAKSGARVFIACRSARKAAQAINYIRQISGNDDIEFLPLDLASLESVRTCVQLFEQKNLPLHILVNNAGIFNKTGITQERFELIWGTNYLGHFLLTKLLLEKLKMSAPSRIIMVSSDMALQPKSIKWELLSKKTPLNFIELYSLSKFCLLLLTAELARKLNNTQVTVNAVHPGLVQSNITVWHRLSKYLGIGISPKDGAYSTLFCATASEVEGISGKFFDPKGREIPLPQAAQDVRLAEELWEKSCLWTGCDQEGKKPRRRYDGSDGIWGPYSLGVENDDMAFITKNIVKKVLPKLPIKILVNSLISIICKFQFGSFLLLLIEFCKQEFFMERHLDSAVIWQLCQEQALLEKLKEYLGEDLVLWRSEIWASYPSQQLIPFWHQDSYPKLLKGDVKSINAYIALTEVNEFNGFEYIPTKCLPSDCSGEFADPFSGNHFFKFTEEMEKQAIPVILRPGEFVLFTDQLVHRSIRNTSGQVRLSITLRVIPSSVRIQPGYTPIYNPAVSL